MDEMRFKLGTKFMKGIAAKIISKVIFKNSGVKPDVVVNDLLLEKNNNKIKLHLNIEAEIDDSDILKITRILNLDA